MSDDLGHLTTYRQQYLAGLVAMAIPVEQHITHYRGISRATKTEYNTHTASVIDVKQESPANAKVSARQILAEEGPAILTLIYVEKYIHSVGNNSVADNAGLFSFV